MNIHHPCVMTEPVDPQHSCLNRRRQPPQLVSPENARRGGSNPLTDPHTQTPASPASSHSSTMSSPESEDTPRPPEVIPIDSTENEATPSGSKSKKRRKKTQAARKKRRTDTDGAAKPSEPQKTRMDWAGEHAVQNDYLRTLLPAYVNADWDTRKATRRLAAEHIFSNWPSHITAGDWKEVSHDDHTTCLNTLPIDHRKSVSGSKTASLNTALRHGVRAAQRRTLSPVKTPMPTMSPRGLTAAWKPSAAKRTRATQPSQTHKVLRTSKCLTWWRCAGRPLRHSSSAFKLVLRPHRSCGPTTTTAYSRNNSQSRALAPGAAPSRSYGRKHLKTSVRGTYVRWRSSRRLLQTAMRG